MNFLSPNLSQNIEIFFKKIFIIYSKVVRIQNQSSAESAKIYRRSTSYLVEKINNDINYSTWVLNELSNSEYIVKPIHYNILVKINPRP